MQPRTNLRSPMFPVNAEYSAAEYSIGGDYRKFMRDRVIRAR
jgi:hypothetical protein